VNRASFHDWERRPPSARALEDSRLTHLIRAIHERARGVYGARRIHAELRHTHGIRVGRKRVERLMRQVGISGLVTKKRRRTTIRVPGVRIADLTYLSSWEGTVYLAAVIDCFSRRVVGWSMGAPRAMPMTTPSARRSSPRSRRSSSAVSHGPRGASCRAPSSTTSRRSSTGNADTARWATYPLSSTKESLSL